VYFEKPQSQSGPSQPATWVGSLVANGEDGTSLLYGRNRFYEPASGQFTQQDPIGIGGGLNVYGFAAGDPVNFGDPFGLSCEGLWKDELAAVADSQKGAGQKPSCWGEAFSFAANAVLDTWALTGVGEGALLIAKGAGKLAVGAVLSTTARSVGTLGIDVAGKRAFLGSVAAGARSYAELGAYEMTQGGFRGMEGYTPEAVFVGTAGASQQHSLSGWDFVPGHGTWVAGKALYKCWKERLATQ